MINKTIYLGTSHIAFDLICKHPDYNLQCVICEAKRITPAYANIAKKNGIEILSFVNKEELMILLDSVVDTTDLFIIYQFDYIIPKQFSTSDKFYNFHSGSLSTNRGAHPIIRSILNGDTKTELTLHRINEQIDQGMVVGTFEVKIDQTDDTISLKEKTEKGLLPLLDKLMLFLKGDVEANVINGGTYYKPIRVEDYTINPEFDSEIQISNKIRSQKQYKGAVLVYNGQKYNIKNIEHLGDLISDKYSIDFKNHFFVIKRLDTSFKLIIKED
jgi:methionyl-tRNA formyltransferase